MRKSIFKKLKSTAGLSLAETMMAVLLLAIVFTAVGGGVVVMQRDYGRIVVRAEQQTTLATAISLVTADLESATQVQCDADDQVISFYNNRRSMFMTYGQGDSGSLVNAGSIGNTAASALYTSTPGSIQVWPQSGLGGARTTGTDGHDLTIPLLTKATEVLESGGDTKLKTLLSPVKVHRTADGRVAYFECTVGVTAKGAAVTEYQQIYVRPYNDVQIG